MRSFCGDGWVFEEKEKLLAIKSKLEVSRPRADVRLHYNHEKGRSDAV